MLQNIPIDESLDIAGADRALADCTVGHTLRYYESVTSTMPIAKEIGLQTGSLSGVVVVAEEQSAGRGRLDRQWHAPARRALLFSIVLKAPHLPAEPGRLPILAGLAVTNALDVVGLTDGLQAGLKWPNDILLRRTPGQERKVGGVLIESIFSANTWCAAIVGVGVNVNQLQDDLPMATGSAVAPTSLRIELGRVIDRTMLFIAICRAWEEALRLSSFQLVAAWRSRLWTLDQPVTLHGENGVVLEGVAVDAQPDGGLVVEDASGHRHIVIAGDVTSHRGAR